MNHETALLIYDMSSQDCEDLGVRLIPSSRMKCAAVGVVLFGESTDAISETAARLEQNPSGCAESFSLLVAGRAAMFTIDVSSCEDESVGVGGDVEQVEERQFLLRLGNCAEGGVGKSVLWFCETLQETSTRLGIDKFSVPVEAAVAEGDIDDAVVVGNTCQSWGEVASMVRRFLNSR